MRLTALAFLLVGSSMIHAAPNATALYPAGGARGTTVDVRALGTFPIWPPQVWCDNPAVTIKPAKEKGRFSVTIPADVAPGPCALRFHDADGASEVRLFQIGIFPEVEEKDPNDAADRPQILASVPVVVNGRLNPSGDVDHFAVTLKKGQTLVASLAAERLGSPTDAVLQVVSPDGFVLADSHDVYGLDPHLAFPVPGEGTYVVRVFGFPSTPDSSIRFAGGDNYIYRLTLTTGGYADHAFPLAVTRGSKEPIALHGWNMPAPAPSVTPPADANPGEVRLADPAVAGVVAVRVEPHATAREGAHPKPPPYAVPITGSGHIGEPGERDTWFFVGRKGARLQLQVEATSLGSPLDPVIRLLDSEGKVLQEVDDPTRNVSDPELSFTVPADGTYRAEVRDRFDHGGWRYAYRLRIVPAVADFAISVAADRYTATVGKELEIPVTVARQNGFDGKLQFRVEGLPKEVRLVGTKESSGRRGAKTSSLRIAATAPFNGPIRILAGTDDPAAGERVARAGSVEMLWLTVKPGKP